MKKRKTSAWLVALIVIAVGFIAYLIVGDFFWRNTHLVSDSEDAIVQPATVPPPGGERR